MALFCGSLAGAESPDVSGGPPGVYSVHTVFEAARQVGREGGLPAIASSPSPAHAAPAHPPRHAAPALAPAHGHATPGHAAPAPATPPPLPVCSAGKRPVCRFYLRDTVCCNNSMGLTTDRPAVELWLVCSERVGVNASCMRAAFSSPGGARLAVNHTLVPAFNAPVASSFRFMLGAGAAALDATVAVGYGSVPAPTGAAEIGSPATAHAPAAVGHVTHPSTTRPNANRPAHHSAATEPQCNLDLAVPCRDANGTEHRSAAPVPPFAWRFAPTPAGGLYGTAGLDGGAYNATRETPVVNWAWLADTATPGNATAGACEERLLWELPPAFLQGGWPALAVRGYQRSCSLPNTVFSGYAPKPAPGPAPRP
ncbi:hypothetical protein WJX81_005950 [Elliptochloris bilobata]|uniref:Uncharacterized protein n=1 Tax=Elliptochloris bilobata TaxID=381761 RepID=A0AAW1RMQ7_9CHLO